MPHVTEEIWTQLPARETRLIVAPWADGAAVDGDFGALDRAQTAARIYRRSQVRIALDGDALRIFEAVVRPTADGGGDIGAERARLQKEIDRAEKMLANEKFVANADPAAVEGEREKLAQYLAERDALA
jgi:valyl-tRNA synthetase